MSILKKIDSPEDLRRLEMNQLPQLASEIREMIIDVVSKNSGHLAANLGVVELLIALHYVFDFKKDMLVFDVSHQSYTHKILTGRRESFKTLRLKDGISGFTNPEESEFDIFIAGHAGTAFSTAMGLAMAERLRGGGRRVIALVGDGALGAGMSLEALNHAGALKPNILVLLNDNKMSISPTVGAFARYLSKVRTGALYRDVRRRIKKFASTLPKLLQEAEHTVERVLSSLRSALLPPGALFEELGFTYYGPIDGHDINLLVSLLRRLKEETSGPTILHVVTQKGRGFEPAELDPELYHGASAGMLSPDGKVRTETLKAGDTFTDAFAETLLRLAEEEEKMVAITAGMPAGTGLIRFRERFPERFFDVGICEQHALGLAAGLAKNGFLPVVAIYSTFLQRAFDQLFHEIALQHLPCIIAVDRAGVVGRDGPTHHGVFDIAYTRILPHFVVAAVKEGNEFYPLMRTAMRERIALVVRYPRDRRPDKRLSFTQKKVTIGRAEVILKGRKLAIFAYGSTVNYALDATNIIKQRCGLSPTVVDLRFAKPLDTELINRIAEKHSILLSVEEGCKGGGVGAALAETLIGTPFIKKLYIHAIDDKFIPHASRGELLRMLSLDAEGIATVAENLLKKPPRKEE